MPLAAISSSFFILNCAILSTTLALWAQGQLRLDSGVEQTNLMECYLNELGLVRETEYFKNSIAGEDM